MSDLYTLDSYELAVLLAGLGADALYGLDLELGDKCDRSYTVRAIHNLFTRSLLMPEEDGFSLESELQACLLNCIDAHRVIRILPCEHEPICCYSGQAESFTLLEPDEARPDGWLLRRVEADALVPLLRDKEYLPSGFNSEIQRMRERLPRYWTEREMGNSPQGETLLRLEGVALDSDEVLVILITRGPLEYELIYGAERQPYSEDRLNEMIRAWFDEKESAQQECDGGIE